MNQVLLFATSSIVASVTLLFLLNRRRTNPPTAKSAVATTVPPRGAIAPPPPPPPNDATAQSCLFVPATRIAAAYRGYRIRRSLGPRAQTTLDGHGCLSLRVCGANNCCQRGGDKTLAAIEDMVPPGAASYGSAPCFGRCSVGPNVGVSSSSLNDRKRSLRSCVDTHRATSKLLRSVGIHVPAAILRASALREEAQAERDRRHHERCCELSRSGFRSLQQALGGALLAGSVTALRLAHRLLMLRAASARELGEIAPWLESARDAQRLQERLLGAHEAGPRAHHAWHGPRLVPALLLTAEAHLRSMQSTPPASSRGASKQGTGGCCGLELNGGGVGGGGQAGEDAGAADTDVRECHRHRKEAHERLLALSAPPFDPPRSRYYRVRAYERREVERLLARI